MPEASWPFYGAETNETQFSKWARTLADSGIAAGLAITPGTGMQVSLAEGSALVRGIYYENTVGPKAVAVGAAPAAGTTRLDALILRLDQGANTITFVVKAGTANSTGGTLPTLTQDENTWELLLGTVAVPAGVAAVTSGMITQMRPSIGERVLVGTAALRPAAASAGEAIFFNSTSKQIEYSDGASWSPLITVDILTGVLPLAKGGTGLTTYKALREALGIYVQPTAPAGGPVAGRVWIPGTAMA